MNKKKKLKIGIFIDTFYPLIDGVVISTDNLARELSKTNDVYVICPEEGVFNDEELPYKVIRIKSHKIPFMEYKIVNIKGEFSKEYKSLMKIKFDIVHIESPFNIGKLGIKISKDKNIPCIGTLHTRFDYEVGRMIKNKFLVNYITKKIINVFNKTDKCIVVNDPLVDEIKKYGYKYEPVVIYNGTDMNPLRHKKEKLDKVNKLYNLNENDTVLLFVGRIIDIKNIFFLLESLKLLKEDNFKFKMLFVGEGPESDKLKNMIDKYNMNDCVILTGKITDRVLLSSIYLRSNLLLFPSVFDTSSLVRIEASVNETPGLFIEGSMVGMTVKDKYNGYLSKEDIYLYKNRIKEIMSDKKQLFMVSKRAKRTLGMSYSNVAKRINNLYLEEIENKKLKC